jgi:ribosomal protein S2
MSYSVDKECIHEANILCIPTIAICDTDCDASKVTYPIPCNDDALTSVSIVGHSLAYAAVEGRDILYGKNTSAPLPSAERSHSDLVYNHLTNAANTKKL